MNGAGSKEKCMNARNKFAGEMRHFRLAFSYSKQLKSVSPKEWEKVGF